MANGKLNHNLCNIPINERSITTGESVKLRFRGNGCILLVMRSNITRQICVFDYWSSANACKIVDPDTTDHMTYTKSANSNEVTISRAEGTGIYAAWMIAIGGWFEEIE